jgi:hypothetical protein
MMTQLPASVVERHAKSASQLVDELLARVQHLGALSPCPAQQAGMLMIVAGLNRPLLAAAAREAAQSGLELTRVELLDDYRRELTGS